MAEAPDRFLQATTALLVASATLIVPSLADLGASLGLAVALAALAGVAFAGREFLAAVPPFVGYAPGPYLRSAWLGPLVGAGVALVGLGASSGELQALGGLCGLVGMVAYFLRPIYGMGLAAWRFFDRRLEATRER